jgi:hypothetical protein
MSRDDEGDGVSAVAAAAAEPHQTSRDADTVVAHSRIEHGQRVQLERCVTSFSTFPAMVYFPHLFLAQTTTVTNSKFSITTHAHLYTQIEANL